VVPDESGLISIPFTIRIYGRFRVYVRTNSPSGASDSYWLNIANRSYVKLEGLSTSGEWVLFTTEDILAGKHTQTNWYLREWG
jgi:hypothetical protein